MPAHTIDGMAASKKWEEIYLADQLRIQREAGQVLSDFSEGAFGGLKGLGTRWYQSRAPLLLNGGFVYA
jgi:hypothetical protein